MKYVVKLQTGQLIGFFEDANQATQWGEQCAIGHWTIEPVHEYATEKNTPAEAGVQL